VPPLITQARIDWGKDAFSLPNIQDYDVYDLPMTNLYPAIGFYLQNDVNFDHRDFSDRMEEEYWRKYQGTVTVWVQTPYTDADGHLPANARDEAIRLRDDLVELVGQALLLTPSLGHPDEAWLEESSIAVNRFDPMRAKENSPAWLCGANIPVVYNVKSHLVRAAMGAANTIHVVPSIHPAEMP
jgi:hypothetical protein